jgi:CDP-paratose 2-epimerase
MNIVISGGAGFIGANAAFHLLARGHDVTLYDNLSRPGAERNVSWLRGRYGDRVALVVADVRDYEPLAKTVAGADAVIHLAGQVAVTTSVQDPRSDFESNALGTFNALEALRLEAPTATFLYASTNKVYGGMQDIAVVEQETRYAYADYPHGIPETYPLDFHSPYGCSKGAGDQYAVDYARIYGLNTIVLRQSCIYGPRQFGVEDQGWVAHFVIAATLGRHITIYGDGKQVRDILHIQDLLRLYEACLERGPSLAGTVLNVGGGPRNTLSVWAEFGPLLAEYLGHPVPVQLGDWRPGDQRVFVADIRRAEALLGWTPTIRPAAGIHDLVRWVQSDPSRFNL